MSEKRGNYYYCQDFCPIYYALEDFNRGARRDCERLRCPDGFCEKAADAVKARRRRIAAEKRKKGAKV